MPFFPSGHHIYMKIFHGDKLHDFKSVYLTYIKQWIQWSYIDACKAEWHNSYLEYVVFMLLCHAGILYFGILSFLGILTGYL